MSAGALESEIAAHNEDPSDLPPSQKAVAGRTPLQLAWARLRKDKAALFCAVVIVVLVLLALFAPLITKALGQGPYAPDLDPQHGGLSIDGLPGHPSVHHLLGTDDEGRDVLARLLYGARTSLFIGLAATVLQIVVGTVAGLLAGFYRGSVDLVLSRFMDILLAFPVIIVGLALVSRLGAHTWVTLLIIAGFGWSSLARIVRGQVLALREREFVEAAKSLGASDARIMFVDILPNLLAPIIVYGTLLIPVNIVFESTLSFLGLGVQPPNASWGQMLGAASGVYQQAWWFLVFPAVALLITTLSFNILGDGLRDALDPRYDRTVAK